MVNYDFVIGAGFIIGFALIGALAAFIPALIIATCITIVYGQSQIVQTIPIIGAICGAIAVPVITVVS